MAGGDRVERSVVRSTLPVYLNRFIGRAAEVAAVSRLLDQHRIVTLTGPGGLGKTRLAVSVAEHVQSRWGGGVRFADYSGATDPGVVTAELASVLGLRHEPGRVLVERLVEGLPRERCLLVIDGCEGLPHVVGDVAVALLRSAPGLHILATSRQRLDVAGEVLFSVLPLSMPADAGAMRVEELRNYDAIVLFEERAAASMPGFEITAASAEVVTRLCTQLDGIPLALELAAARLRMMSLLDVEAHLADRFQLLTGGATERHGSVRTTIDWSYRLLDEDERARFRRLSALPGGFRLDAAAAILGDEGMGLVDALGRLVDKSLLTARTDVDGRTRYQMLETIRKYGVELLTESGELEDVITSSMAHFHTIAEASADRADSAEWPAWLDLLHAEHDNILAILVWAHERQHPGLPTLVVSLGWFWQRGADPAEGRRWLDVARGMVREDHDRLSVLRWATALAAQESDITAALTWAEEALQLADRLGDRVQAAHARLALGNLVFHQEQGPEWARQAATLYEAALALYDEVGLTFRGIAVLLNLSLLDLSAGDIRAGRRRAALAEERARAGRWRHWEWRCRIRFGIAAFLEESDEEAERHFTDCFRYGMENPEFGGRTRVALSWLAAVAARRGQASRSARLVGGAIQLVARNQVESSMPRTLTRIQAEWQARVRDELGDVAYEQSVQAGRTMPLRELKRLALRGDPEEAGSATPLSTRELQIVELVAEGLTNRAVSTRLHLSPRTVDAHLDHVRNKLGIRTRAQMVRWLMESRAAGGQRDHDGLLTELDVPARSDRRTATLDGPPVGDRAGR
jgi:predicted ATPase/DNA-binding CsgD family transcriptional regulator